MIVEAPDRPAVPMHQLSRAMGAGAAISAARAAGLFALLDGVERTPAEVAAAKGLDERATGLLLDALVDVGVVARRGTRYIGRIGEDVVEVVGAAWDGIPSFLATGRPVRRMDQQVQASRAYASVTGALADVPADLRERVVGAIGDPGRWLLDLGAGAAPWSRALCARHPATEVLAVDLPAVTRVTRAAIERDGLTDRMRVVEGDLFTADLGEAHDTVLIAGVCRLFGETDARHLLGRAAAATAPGGRIAVLDALPDGDRDDDGSVGVYALGLAVRTGRGRVHRFADYAAWLYDAGFVRIEAVPLGTPELTLIRATRPG